MEEKAEIRGRYLSLQTVREALENWLLPPPVQRAAEKRAEKWGLFASAKALCLCGRATEICWELCSLVEKNGRELWDLFAMDGDRARLLAAGGMARGGTPVQRRALRLAAAQIASEDSAGSPGQCGEYFLGDRKAFAAHNIALPYAVAALEMPGYEMLLCAERGEFSGFFLFRAACRPYARAVYTTLSADGIGARTVGAHDLRFPAAAGEKDLQKQDDRATMVVQEKEIRVFDAEEAGRIERSGISPMEVYHAVSFGRKLVLIRKKNGFVIALELLLFFLFLFPAPLLAILTLLFCGIGNTVLDIRAIRQFAPPCPAATEEETMFGKVHYTMKIEGMSCAHCSARVKEALESLHGVSAKVSLEEKNAQIKCPSALAPEKLTGAVTGAGFTVVSVERV